MACTRFKNLPPYLDTYYGVRLSFLDGEKEVTYPSPYEQFLPLPTPFFKMFLERFFNDPYHTLYFKPLSMLLPSLIHHPCPPPNISTLFCSRLSLTTTYISCVRTIDVCILTVRVSQSILYPFMLSLTELDQFVTRG